MALNAVEEARSALHREQAIRRAEACAARERRFAGNTAGRQQIEEDWLPLALALEEAEAGYVERDRCNGVVVNA